jgi:hypothetical protein
VSGSVSENTNTPPASLSAGRTCGDCRLCCKLPDIPELSKPRDRWCQNASRERGTEGCTIYNDRPQVCREFSCAWLSGLGKEQDRPDKLGVMWQPLDLPDGRPGIGVVEARPGALDKPRARMWLQTFENAKPGQVVVRRYEHPVFQMPTIGGRTEAAPSSQIEPRPGLAVRVSGGPPIPGAAARLARAGSTVPA